MSDKREEWKDGGVEVERDWEKEEEIEGEEQKVNKMMVCFPR